MAHFRGLNGGRRALDSLNVAITPIYIENISGQAIGTVFNGF